MSEGCTHSQLLNRIEQKNAAAFSTQHEINIGKIPQARNNHCLGGASLSKGTPHSSNYLVVAM
jgi:hypothetical protein